MIIVPAFLELQFKTFMVLERISVPSRKKGIVSGGVIYFLWTRRYTT
jgi:hypothetical protein